MNANQGYQRPAAAANYPRGISPVIPGDALLLDICDDVELLYDVIDELNMDGILQQVLSFPPNPPPTVPLSDKDYDKQVRAVVQVLNATSGKKLTGGVSTGEDLLDFLILPDHTLPYLYALLAHISSSQGKSVSSGPNRALLPGGRLWEPALHFVENFDPVQIRYAGPELGQLIAAFESTARKASMPSVAIQPIKSAILRLDPSGSCFTSTHLTFVRLCLESREFAAAKPVLDKDIFAFPVTSDSAAHNALHPYPCSQHESSSTYITYTSGLTNKSDYKDHLQYFLLGGMIYTGLKDWERALHFYEIAVIWPINNKLSMIQVEAYKKRVLVGILAHGGPLPMPKTTTSHAAKLYRSLARAYDALADIFQEGIVNETDASTLIAEANAGAQVWQDDTNHGLMNQVIGAFRRFTVLKLGKTYGKLKISDVLSKTSSTFVDATETANYVKGLIASGGLKGFLTETGSDAGAWDLRFFDEAEEEPSENQQFADIIDLKDKIEALNLRIRESDHKLGLTKEYLEWSKKVASQKEGSGTGVDEGTGDFMTMDEDMMVDI